MRKLDLFDDDALQIIADSMVEKALGKYGDIQSILDIDTTLDTKALIEALKLSINEGLTDDVVCRFCGAKITDMNYKIRSCPKYSKHTHKHRNLVPYLQKDYLIEKNYCKVIGKSLSHKECDTIRTYLFKLLETERQNMISDTINHNMDNTKYMKIALERLELLEELREKGGM